MPTTVGTMSRGPLVGRDRTGSDRDDTEYADGGQPRLEPAPRHEPGDDGQQHQRDADAAEQHLLVVAAEVGDGEILEPARRVVDEVAADGQDRRGHAVLEDRSVATRRTGPRRCRSRRRR